MNLTYSRRVEKLNCFRFHASEGEFFGILFFTQIFKLFLKLFDSKLGWADFNKICNNLWKSLINHPLPSHSMLLLTLVDVVAVVVHSNENNNL